jgi:hypothetical protein
VVRQDLLLGNELLDVGDDDDLGIVAFEGIRRTQDNRVVLDTFVVRNICLPASKTRGAKWGG